MLTSDDILGNGRESRQQRMPSVPRDTTSIHALCRSNDFTSLVSMLNISKEQEHVRTGGGVYSDATLTLVNFLDEYGSTPLHICAMLGSYECASLLLQHGAAESLYKKDWESSWTPLHCAFYFNQVKVAVLLLKAGATLSDQEYTTTSSSSSRRNTSGPRSILTATPSFSYCSHKGSSSSNSLDNEGNNPLSLLSIFLAKKTTEARAVRNCTSIASFGKADFPLGFPLPNRADVPTARLLEVLQGCKHGNGDIEVDQVVRVYAAKYSSACLTKHGDVYSWGHGKHGRLGHGNDSTMPEPQRIDNFPGTDTDTCTCTCTTCTCACKGTETETETETSASTGICIAMRDRAVIRALSMGENHCLAIDSRGRLFTWGSSKYGKLGLGHSSSSSSSSSSDSTKYHDCVSVSVPTQVPSLKKCFVVHIAAGETHSLCCTEKGQVYSWGGNKFGQLGLGAPTVSISTNKHCPNAGNSSRRGYRYGETAEVDIPRHVVLTSCDIPVSASTSAYTCTQSAYPNSKNNMFSTAMSSDRTILQLAAGSHSSLVLVMAAAMTGKTTNINDNNRNDVWQFGFGSPSPVRVSFASRALALKEDRLPGSSSSKSSDMDMDIDIGSNSNRKTKNKVNNLQQQQQQHQINACSTRRIPNIVQVSAGRSHHCALSSIGHVYSWGAGGDFLGHEASTWIGAGKRLGTSASEGVGEAPSKSQARSLLSPQLVEKLLPENGGGKIVHICASSNRTCATSEAGDLYTWGATDYTRPGVLGHGTGSSYEPIPRKVTSIKNVASVAAGEDHTLVLLAFKLPELPLHEIVVMSSASSSSSSSTSLKSSALHGTCKSWSGPEDYAVPVTLDVTRARSSSSYHSDSDSPSDSDSDFESNLTALALHRPLVDAEWEDDDALFHLHDALALDVVKREHKLRNKETARSPSTSADSAYTHTHIHTQVYYSSPPSLKGLCERALASNITLSNSLTMHSVAEVTNSPLLKKFCQEFIEDNLDAVLVHYTDQSSSIGMQSESVSATSTSTSAEAEAEASCRTSIVGGHGAFTGAGADIVFRSLIGDEYGEAVSYDAHAARMRAQAQAQSPIPTSTSTATSMQALGRNRTNSGVFQGSSSSNSNSDSSYYNNSSSNSPTDKESAARERDREHTNSIDLNETIKLDTALAASRRTRALRKKIASIEELLSKCNDSGGVEIALDISQEQKEKIGRLEVYKIQLITTMRIQQRLEKEEAIEAMRDIKAREVKEIEKEKDKQMQKKEMEKEKEEKEREKEKEKEKEKVHSVGTTCSTALASSPSPVAGTGKITQKMRKANASTALALAKSANTQVSPTGLPPSSFSAWASTQPILSSSSSCPPLSAKKKNNSGSKKWGHSYDFDNGNNDEREGEGEGVISNSPSLSISSAVGARGHTVLSPKCYFPYDPHSVSAPSSISEAVLTPAVGVVLNLADLLSKGKMKAMSTDKKSSLSLDHSYRDHSHSQSQKQRHKQTQAQTLVKSSSAPAATPPSPPPPPSPLSLTLVEIQRQEEDLNRMSYKRRVGGAATAAAGGGGAGWYIERKLRAGSLESIMLEETQREEERKNIAQVQEFESKNRSNNSSNSNGKKNSNKGKDKGHPHPHSRQQGKQVHEHEHRHGNEEDKRLKRAHSAPTPCSSTDGLQQHLPTMASPTTVTATTQASARATFTPTAVVPVSRGGYPLRASTIEFMPGPKIGTCTVGADVGVLKATAKEWVPSFATANAVSRV